MAVGVVLLLTGVASGVAMWTLTVNLMDVFVVFPTLEWMETVDRARSALLPASLLCAGALYAVAAQSRRWTDRLPGDSDAPCAAGAAGAAVGAVTAGMMADGLPAARVGHGLGAVFAVIAVALGLRTIRQTRDHHRELRRVARFRVEGRQTKARVVNVASTNTWRIGEPLFDLALEYDTPSGVRRIERQQTTAAADAPVIGGTMLVWFRGDGSNTQDVLVAEDPDSVRHPDIARFTPPKR